MMNNIHGEHQIKRVYITTSSRCPINNLDNERFKSFFKSNGYEITDAIDKAEFVITSTCSCRKERADESMSLVEKVKSQINKKAVLIVCGCLPIIDKNRLKSVFNGTSLGPNDYDRLDKIFNAKIKFSEIKMSYPLNNRFVVPVCSGCIWNCSYCVIKKARGRLQSRERDSIVKDIKTGLNDGYKVIDLEGEDVGSYGIDIGIDFPALLNEIINIRRKFSIRILRFNPYWLVHYFDELRKLFTSPKVKFISVPIQSGSDEILKKMNRKYGVEDVRRCLKNLQKESPKLRISTDIIVGFPGESDNDFLDTVNLIREVNFVHVFVYKFTNWRGTPASNYKNVVCGPIMEKRFRRLQGEALLISRIPQIMAIISKNKKGQDNLP